MSGERGNSLTKGCGDDVRIAHGHHDGGVSEQSLDDRNRHARGGEPRGEGVTERVPADGTERCAFTCAVERVLGRTAGKRKSVATMKDKVMGVGASRRVP
jgi:hypothetical protein